jgi:GrpB-like predicted nucleotidyltransferase (UPF0157 family)
MAVLQERGAIGLEKSTVLLQPHDPGWIERGSREVDIVLTLLGPLAVGVRHIGSTSVAELEAKPILDLAAAVPEGTSIDELVERLGRNGDYSYQGDQGQEGGGLLFVRGVGDFRTVHLHVVSEESDAWELYLRFQLLLREDPTARSDYQDEKRRLARLYPSDRLSYTEAKGDIIRTLLAQGSEETPDH